MEEPSELQRDLGFWSALTIGAGTMIGAGIFLLAGRAIEAAGPAALFSYAFAGIVCILTRGGGHVATEITPLHTRNQPLGRETEQQREGEYRADNALHGSEDRERAPDLARR